MSAVESNEVTASESQPKQQENNGEKKAVATESPTSNDSPLKAPPAEPAATEAPASNNDHQVGSEEAHQASNGNVNNQAEHEEEKPDAEASEAETKNETVEESKEEEPAPKEEEDEAPTAEEPMDTSEPKTTEPEASTAAEESKEEPKVMTQRWRRGTNNGKEFGCFGPQKLSYLNRGFFKNWSKVFKIVKRPACAYTRSPLQHHAKKCIRLREATVQSLMHSKQANKSEITIMLKKKAHIF